MSKKLTHEFIATRVKNDRIENIKSINFWGNDIEEVSILKQMQSLEVISLSVNKIKSLREFGYLKNLRELYLRKNLISDLSEVKYLSSCPNLRVLWISENPIAESKNYRLTVISYLPQLTKLDDNVITAEEKNQASNTGNPQSSNSKANENYNCSEEEREHTDENYVNQEEDDVFEVNNFENNNARANQNNHGKENERNFNSKYDRENKNEYVKPSSVLKPNVNLSSSIEIPKHKMRENREYSNEGNYFENNSNNSNQKIVNGKQLNKRGSIDNNENANNAKDRNWDYLDNNNNNSNQKERENSAKYNSKYQNQANANNFNKVVNSKNSGNNNNYNQSNENEDNYYNNNKVEKPERLEKYDYSQNYSNNKGSSNYEDDNENDYVNKKLNNINLIEKKNENKNNQDNVMIKKLSSKKASIDQNVYSNNNINDNYGDIPKYDNQRKLAKMNREPQSQNFNNVNRAINQTPIHTTKMNNNNSNTNASNNQSIQSNYTNPNVVNSIFLLLRELKENDLMSIRDEIDKKLNEYSNFNFI